MMKTSDFLKCFPDFYIQTFDDRDVPFEEKDKSLVTSGTPDKYLGGRLKQLNEKKAGIFFSPNRFPIRRKEELCEGVNAWFVEKDDTSLAEQYAMYSACGLLPSILVESKRSVHAYWLAKNATKDTFRKIQMGLIQKFKGDEACKDITRVLRIPNFYHNKGEPKLVEVTHFAPELLYTEEQMLAEFPYVEVVVKQKNPEPIIKRIDISVKKDFWEHLASLDNRMMLSRMSGGEMVNGEVLSFATRGSGGDYILVNGKMCDAWIDQDGLIGSGKKGGPTWIQWLQFYGHSKSAIRSWFKTHCSDLELAEYLDKNKEVQNVQIPEVPEKKEDKYNVTNVMSHVEDIKKKLSAPRADYEWGVPLLNKSFPIIQPGGYYVIFGQQASGKTLIAFNMARENAKKKEGVYFLSLEMTKMQIIERYIRDRANVTMEQYKNKEFDVDHLLSFAKELENINLVGIDEGQSYTVKDIGDLISKENIKVLFIDNLNKIKGENKNAAEIEVSQEVSQGILNLTRKYNIPIFLIHHANKLGERLKPTKKMMEMTPMDNQPLMDFVYLRGMSGMRGTNKIADDADVVIEVARPISYDEIPLSYKNRITTVLSVYKDREYDARGTLPVFYYRGEFYGDYNEVIVSKRKKEGGHLEELLTVFGGTIVQ